MNRIIIVDEKIKEEKLDKSIEILKSENVCGINKIEINIKGNCDLTMDYTSTKKTKLDICFNICQNVKCNLYEIKKGDEYKLGYKFNLEEESILNIYKINDTKKINELLVFNLNGEKSQLNYVLKTISTYEEKYDLMVYHNLKKSESNIVNNGVNIKEGKLTFNVSGFVPNGITDCILNQNNRIINLTDNKCMIRPNLFIDENDVIANHSAHIGKCNDDEMFYLLSRGINRKEAENLIIKGFLLKGLCDNKNIMEEIINKYWR